MQLDELCVKYGIAEGLPDSQKLAAFEKEKQKVLRKLNHVFGNPSKEEELTRELQALEDVMAAIEKLGGRLSLDDIELETRELSQTQIQPGMKQEAAYEKMQIEEGRLLKDEIDDMKEWSEVFYDVLIYHLEQRNFQRVEYWALYGAERGDTYCMKFLSDFYKEAMFENVNQERHFYWMKRGAEAGDKDCCLELGKYYAQ